MTQDEIIEMARQAGAASGKPTPDAPEIVFTQCLDIYRFAKLVAAKERDACLSIAESMSLSDANMSKTWRTGCRDVAEAIRARVES